MLIRIRASGVVVLARLIRPSWSTQNSVTWWRGPSTAAVVSGTKVKPSRMSRTLRLAMRVVLMVWGLVVRPQWRLSSARMFINKPVTFSKIKNAPRGTRNSRRKRNSSLPIAQALGYWNNCGHQRHNGFVTVSSNSEQQRYWMFMGTMGFLSPQLNLSPKWHMTQGHDDIY